MRIAKAIVRKPCHIIFSEQNGEGIIYDTVTDKRHVLNHASLIVWNLCDVEDDPQGIAGKIAGRYNIPVNQVLPDVLECLNRFEELGLIKRSIA